MKHLQLGKEAAGAQALAVWGNFHRVDDFAEGRTGGAVYVSFTVEAGAEDGAFPSRHRRRAQRHRLRRRRRRLVRDHRRRPARRSAAGSPLAPDASRITVRHYWEDERTAARCRRSPTSGSPIELVDGDVPAAPAAPTDGLGRRRHPAHGHLRAQPHARHHGQARRGRARRRSCPATPHVFPPPVPPGAHALAAADAAYSMAPYLLGPDDALVMRGALARVPLRQRLALEPPAADVRLPARPGQPQPGAGRARRRRHGPHGARPPRPGRRRTGSTTEGRPFGLVFWRFMLPEGPIETPEAEVVPVDRSAESRGPRRPTW